MNQRLAQIAMGRAGTVEDVAKVILFLASPLAGYITGQAVNITGGWITFGGSVSPLSSNAGEGVKR